jgi:NitT/TauT family transport system ATP-binding protein
VLTVEDLHHAYAPGQVVTSNITFEVKAGEFVSIVGPSGCGKTTLLKALSGLLDPTGGTITFQGAPVKGVPDGLAMVFQEYGRSLLPWKTVNGNIDLPLRYQKLNVDERRRRIDDSLQAVGIGRAISLAAVRRNAAARRDRASARLPTQTPADGRAVRIGRRSDPCRSGRPGGAGS